MPVDDLNCVARPISLGRGGVGRNRRLEVGHGWYFLSRIA